MTFEYEQKPWLMNQKTILTHNIIIFQRLNLFSKYQVTEISAQGFLGPSAVARQRQQRSRKHPDVRKASKYSGQKLGRGVFSKNAGKLKFSQVYGVVYLIS